VQQQADGMASFATPIGTFKARLPGKTGKLYVRPEHMTLQVGPGAENSVPVTLTEVAFEGNFISVHAVTENGTILVSEIRNDGTSNVPGAGAKLYMTFDARNASILPDSATATSATATSATAGA